MFVGVLRLVAALAAVLLPFRAAAEPITLKLSFFTSDRSVAYLTAIKPFVDAINNEGGKLLKIEVFTSGSLGKVQKELPQMVLDGAADIGFIIPGQNPERFTDNAAIELPGLFRDAREATLTYTALVAADALAGYHDFFVIGAYATQPENIHSRKPIRSLADLKGQKIRVNNSTQAAALRKLGALPAVLAFNETTPAINSGALDGATVPVAQLFDVGIGRFTSNHYLLGTSVAPLTLMMNRKVFDRLPADAKDLIRKYSGAWTAARFIQTYETIDKKAYEDIKAESRRSVVLPSSADRQSAQQAFEAVVQDWAAASAHNRTLLNLTQATLAKFRAPD